MTSVFRLVTRALLFRSRGDWLRLTDKGHALSGAYALLRGSALLRVDGRRPQPDKREREADAREAKSNTGSASRHVC